jgi:ribosomal protein S18 acetylase RimI-like enzyme
MLASFDSVIEHLGDVLRVWSPTSPDYYFGNFLVHDEAPAPGEAAARIARFREAFAHDPAIRHVCLRWDRPDGAAGALDDFVADGFIVDQAVVLTARAVRPPPHPNRDLAVRAVRTDAEWAAVTALQVDTVVEEHGARAADFGREQCVRYRRFVEEGRGVWFGAFDGDALAGDLGVFVAGGLGRFQAVETAPAYRRRGVCGTLVHHAARHAFDALGAAHLVMVADPEYHAARIYESVGFTPAERLVAVYKCPPSDSEN